MEFLKEFVIDLAKLPPIAWIVLAACVLAIMAMFFVAHRLDELDKKEGRL